MKEFKIRDYIDSLETKDMVMTITKFLSIVSKSRLIEIMDMTKKEFEENKNLYYMVFGQQYPTRYWGTNNGFKKLREAMTGSGDTIRVKYDYKNNQYIEITPEESDNEI